MAAGCWKDDEDVDFGKAVRKLPLGGGERATCVMLWGNG